jgi:hypothetical protein
LDGKWVAGRAAAELLPARLLKAEFSFQKRRFGSNGEPVHYLLARSRRFFEAGL